MSERPDYSVDDSGGDPVSEALSSTFRGLPLAYSPAAKAAAFRYGMNLMGLGEDDWYANGTYPGMTDDAAIVLMCSLCSAEAGKDPACPDLLKNLLARRTLSFRRNQLADALTRFFDGFEIDPMDEEIYQVGFGLIAGDTDSTPEPVGGSARGKPQLAGSPQ